MEAHEIIYTEKMKAVIRDDAQFLFLLGSTGCSKSLTANIKFMKQVFQAPKEHSQFAIICSTIKVAEKLIIDNPDSFYNMFSWHCSKYNSSSAVGGAHFDFQGLHGVKKIYLAGADDKNSYQQVLGMNLSGVWLEEMSVLHIDCLREVFGRIQRKQGGKLIGTSNGGLPTQEMYTEFINHAIVQYPETVPVVEMEDMMQDDSRYHYYHFNFQHDAPHMTQEQIEGLYRTYPVGSFYYYSKILGCRGFQDGVLYAKYMTNDLIVDYDKINSNALEEIICSVDMGTNNGLDDTKHAKTIASIVGFSRGYQRVVVLEASVIPSNDLDTIVKEVDAKLYPYWANYYTKLTKIVIDYGDSGGMLVRSWRNKTRLRNVKVKACIKTGKVAGESKAINLQSRAQLKCMLIMNKCLLWSSRAIESFNAHKRILSTPNGEEMEQSNINNDYGDSLTYTLTENWVKVSNISKRRK